VEWGAGLSEVEEEGKEGDDHDQREEGTRAGELVHYRGHDVSAGGWALDGICCPRRISLNPSEIIESLAGCWSKNQSFR